jgi:hypothetical protein
MEMTPPASPPDLHAALTAPAPRSPSLVDVTPWKAGNSDARNPDAGAQQGQRRLEHSFLAVIVTGAALGAGWGAAFGYLAHARTRGARRMLSDAGLLPEKANEW